MEYEATPLTNTKTTEMMVPETVAARIRSIRGSSARQHVFLITVPFRAGIQMVTAAASTYWDILDP